MPSSSSSSCNHQSPSNKASSPSSSAYFDVQTTSGSAANNDHRSDYLSSGGVSGGGWFGGTPPSSTSSTGAALRRAVSFDSSSISSSSSPLLVHASTTTSNNINRSGSSSSSSFKASSKATSSTTQNIFSTRSLEFGLSKHALLALSEFVVGSFVDLWLGQNDYFDLKASEEAPMSSPSPHLHQPAYIRPFTHQISCVAILVKHVTSLDVLWTRASGAFGGQSSSRLERVHSRTWGNSWDSDLGSDQLYNSSKR